jgi:hypothetical protein
MHATGQVRVNTAQLRAQVTDMRIWFNYPEIEAVKHLLSSKLNEIPASDGPLQLIGDATESIRQFTTQPKELANDTSDPLSPKSGRGAGGDGKRTASPLGTAFSNLANIANSASQGNVTSSPKTTSMPKGPGQFAASSMSLPNLSLNDSSQESEPALPMNVTGETLIANLTQTSRRMFVNDLSISGIVTVTRDQASANSPWPLTITGTQLRMDSSDEGRLDATIIGSPAKFAIGSGAIEGPEIRRSILHPRSHARAKANLETDSG